MSSSDERLPAASRASRRAHSPAPPRKLPPTSRADDGERPVGDRLHSAAIHLLRWLREADRASPLPAARLSALSVIVHAGPLSLKALADAEQVRPPTMSRLVGRLVDDGLVLRERDPDDGRGIRIRATERGRGILEDGRRRRMRLLDGALQGLDDGERKALAAGVDVLERLVPGAR